MFKLELKKLLKNKNGMIALITFVFICVVMIFIKPPLEGELSYLEVQNPNFTDIRSEEVKAEQNFQYKIKSLKDTLNGSVSDESTKEIQKMARKKLNDIKKNEDLEYKNVDFFKVFNYRAGHPLMILGMIIIISMLLCNIYSDEVISSMDTLILSSKNKYKCLNAKGILAFVVPIVSYLSYLGAIFITTLIQYGKPVNGSLQCLRILDNFIMIKGAMTINEYILLKTVFVILVLVSIAIVATFISFKTETSISAISILGVYLVSGKVLLMFIKPISKAIAKSNFSWILSVLQYGNYTDLTMGMNEMAGMYLGSANIFGLSLDIIQIITIILALITILVSTCMFLSFKKLSSKK